MRHKVINISLFLIPALVLGFPGGYWLGVLIYSVIGIAMIARRQVTLAYSIQLIKDVPMLWGFFIFIVLHVFLTIYHHEPAKDFGNILPFILSPLVLLAVTQGNPNPLYFWLGCSSGALLAFLIAVVQVYFLDVGRAFGFANPITFGDTAIILGTGAFIGLFYCRSTFQSALSRTYLLAGGVAGMTTSLLSGSKGGWLSVIMVILLLANAALRSLHIFKRLAIVSGILIALALFASLVPKLPVVDRVISAYHGAKTWVQTGQITEGSASIRLEAFKAGMLAGAHSPILGLGRQGQLEVIQAAVNAGLVDKVMIEKQMVGDKHVYSTFSIDNDLINLFSRQGILGVLSAFAVHLGVFFAFWRYRNHSTDSIKAISTFGILLVLLYFEFGLSISVFGVSIFRTMYASWAILLVGLLINEKRRLALLS
jgi:O-antigen ligase